MMEHFSDITMTKMRFPRQSSRNLLKEMTENVLLLCTEMNIMHVLNLSHLTLTLIFHS